MATPAEIYRARLAKQHFPTATGIQTRCRRCGQDVLRVEPKPGWKVIVDDDTGRYHWLSCPGRR